MGDAAPFGSRPPNAAFVGTEDTRRKQKIANRSVWPLLASGIPLAQADPLPDPNPSEKRLDAMTMDRRGFIGITSAGTLVLALPSASRAQAKKLGKIEYGLASLDPIYSAAYIAHKKGLFAE